MQGVSKWAEETDWVHMYSPYGESSVPPSLRSLSSLSPIVDWAVVVVSSDFCSLLLLDLAGFSADLGNQGKPYTLMTGSGHPSDLASWYLYF